MPVWSIILFSVVALYGCTLPPLKGDLVNIDISSTNGIKNPGVSVCQINTKRNGFQHSQLSEKGVAGQHATASLQIGSGVAISGATYASLNDGIFFSLSCKGDYDDIIEDENGSLNFISFFMLDVYIGQAPVGLNYKEHEQYLSTIAREGIEVQGVALTQRLETMSDAELSNDNHDTARVTGIVTVPYRLHDVRRKCAIGVGGSPFEVTRGTLTIPPHIPLSREEALQDLNVLTEGNIVYLRDWKFTGEIQGFVC